MQNDTPSKFENVYDKHSILAKLNKFEDKILQDKCPDSCKNVETIIITTSKHSPDFAEHNTPRTLIKPNQSPY